jgi:hypothetical protein
MRLVVSPNRMHRNETRPVTYWAENCTRGPMIVRWFVVSGLALLPAVAVARLQPRPEGQKTAT